MKPIVSFDVDMTLLDHKDWAIPASALETIEKLRENYTIVLATGRDMDSVFSTGIPLIRHCFERFFLMQRTPLTASALQWETVIIIFTRRW